MGKIQDQINTLHQTIAAAQAQIDTLARQLCQISGTLFNDTDADRSRDSGETLTGVRTIIVQPGNINVQSDASSSYVVANLDPGTYQITRTDFPAGYRLSNPTAPGGSTITVAIAAGEHKTVDIGTTDRLPGKTVPFQASEVAADSSDAPAVPAHTWRAIGGCIALTTEAKDDPSAAAIVAKAASLGLTHLRSFGPTCRTGGALDAGYANAVRRLTARGMRVVVLHGAPENDPAHTTYAEDDWRRFFSAVAAARNDNALYEIELQNELNLAHYWPLGRNDALSAPAISKMMAIVKIARAALGAAATIIGPSIGWGDVGPHLAYQKAMIDAGLLDYVSAINTHFYFARAQQVIDVLGQYRDWIGPTRQIYSTEANPMIAISAFAQTAPPVIAALRDGGVVPMVYRLVPHGGSWDDRCLFDTAGRRNSVVADAWLS